MTVIEYQIAVADSAAVLGACLSVLFIWFVFRVHK
jgi:hypothetical protein